VLRLQSRSQLCVRLEIPDCAGSQVVELRDPGDTPSRLMIAGIQFRQDAVWMASHKAALKRELCLLTLCKGEQTLRML